jgi:hypothetical protein
VLLQREALLVSVPGQAAAMRLVWRGGGQAAVLARKASRVERQPVARAAVPLTPEAPLAA